MKIAFSEISIPKRGSLALGVFAGGKLTPVAEEIDKASGGALTKAIGASRFTGKKGQWLEVVAPAGVDVRRIMLFGLGEADKIDLRQIEDIGGNAVSRCNSAGEKSVTVVLEDMDGKTFKPGEAAVRLAFGATLGGYRFDKYRTKIDEEKRPTLERFTVAIRGSATARRHYAYFDKLAEGVSLTRDLVSEPANSLYPESFAERCKELIELGVVVEVLDEAKMRELGMGALLGVGQGSAHESRLVVMQWNGLPGRSRKKPVAFVGKGVCFDTGGISLKPAAGMEDMKWDMGGAGAVTGLMKAVAGRKAKVNVVGVIALAENMPDGNAQRPGDIVTSMSGQTIEVLNTDAEGRLVLADALWYAQDRFKPEAMIDLATLTGAIIVSLGSEYAGLFSNNDELADRLFAAGKEEGEGVWRFPMGEPYAKQIESPVADLQNIARNGKGAGSILGAEFLKKFVNEVPWAHIDIAGVAWSTKDKPTVPKGGTGFGVRLLDNFLRTNYEK